MIIDTHAHYDDEKFDVDRHAFLSALPTEPVEKIINASASMEECDATLKLVDAYPGMYGMLGVHPDEIGGLTEADMAFIQEKSAHPKIVAIGEIGLDYHWNVENKETQAYWFKRQMQVAREVGLPICVHSRDAAADTLAVMQEAHAEDIGGVIHCYSYSPEMAAEYLKLGFYFGIGGVVTFKNGKKCKESVAMLPMDRIILETDAPYLAPEPFRGQRNESPYLTYVAEEIAKIRGISAAEVIERTTENAMRLYPKLKNA